MRELSLFCRYSVRETEYSRTCVGRVVARPLELTGVRFFRHSVGQESLLAVSVRFYAPCSKRKKIAGNIFLRLVQTRCRILRHNFLS
jgi:hypothetical protein